MKGGLISVLFCVHRLKLDLHIERPPVAGVLTDLDGVVSKGSAPFDRSIDQLRADLVQNLEWIVLPLILAVLFYQQRAESAQNGKEKSVWGSMCHLFAIEPRLKPLLGVF